MPKSTWFVSLHVAECSLKGFFRFAGAGCRREPTEPKGRCGMPDRTLLGEMIDVMPVETQALLEDIHGPALATADGQ